MAKKFIKATEKDKIDGALKAEAEPAKSKAPSASAMRKKMYEGKKS